MKYFGRTAATLSFDHKTSEGISEEMKVETVDEKQRRYKSNWLQYVTRMSNSRMAKVMLNCRTDGRGRRLRRTLKRASDEAETGLLRYN
jgi:hypothetical protein